MLHMIRTNISLHQEQHDLIKERGEETGCSLSWIIREALDEYFEDKHPSLSINTSTSTSKPIPPSPRGQCKVCGAGLNEFGDFCLGKGKHKQ